MYFLALLSKACALVRCCNLHSLAAPVDSTVDILEMLVDAELVAPSGMEQKYDRT